VIRIGDFVPHLRWRLPRPALLFMDQTIIVGVAALFQHQHCRSEGRRFGDL
jgi:hypothetical protein